MGNGYRRGIGRGERVSELTYLLSVLLSLAAYAVAGLALWGAVEGVYYIWCKVTGREY